MLKSITSQFRFIAFLEGLSFILLMGIAMPLKYFYGNEEATQEVGMLHGLLFMLYTYMLFPMRKKHNWTWFQTGMAFIASLLPFGTFIAEYRWFRKL